MADRRVRQSKKDQDGDIIALCNRGELWSPRRKSDAISDIKSGVHRYFVREAGEGARVRVVQGSSGEYLRTDADESSANNLDNLPDC